MVKLAALNKKFGLRGAYQNHAGESAMKRDLSIVRNWI